MDKTIALSRTELAILAKILEGFTGTTSDRSATVLNILERTLLGAPVSRETLVAAATDLNKELDNGKHSAAWLEYQIFDSLRIMGKDI